jgi:hypothetical protein
VVTTPFGPTLTTVSPSLPGRVGLALVTVALGVGGVAVATDGGPFPAGPAGVTIAPAAGASPDLSCALTGEWTAPERGSVGLPPGLRLCPEAAQAPGPVTVDTPGALVDGWDLRGGLVVTARAVVVQRSRITGDGSTGYGIVTIGDGSVRVQDTTITGRFGEAALGGGRWTAERVEIVGVTADGAHAGPGCRLIASVLSRFEPGAGTDGVDVRAGDVVVEDSTVRMGAAHRSAVRIAPGDDGPDEGAVVLRANVFGGGEYSVVQPAPALADVELVDNRFARDAREAPLRLPPAARVRGSTYTDGAPVDRG